MWNACAAFLMEDALKSVLLLHAATVSSQKLEQRIHISHMKLQLSANNGMLINSATIAIVLCA